MTTKTFQEFFSDNLSGFGWSLSDTEIPDWTTYTDAVHGPTTRERASA